MPRGWTDYNFKKGDIVDIKWEDGKEFILNAKIISIKKEYGFTTMVVDANQATTNGLYMRHCCFTNNVVGTTITKRKLSFEEKMYSILLKELQ